MPVDLRDPAATRTPSQGQCFLYVFPCAYEDLLKVGFSRDPLQRLQALHRRWYEFFDPERIVLVETDTVREARALELSTKHRLADLNAPAPMTVAHEAGGHGEWYRGAGAQLEVFVRQLRRQGYRTHAPADDWLRQALHDRCELLYSWTEALLTVDELELNAGSTPGQRIVRDALDAFSAVDIALDEWLPAAVLRWYRAGGGLV
jgi:T5orf172 domain-containing protein